MERAWNSGKRDLIKSLKPFFVKPYINVNFFKITANIISNLRFLCSQLFHQHIIRVTYFSFVMVYMLSIERTFNTLRLYADAHLHVLEVYDAV